MVGLSHFSNSLIHFCKWKCKANSKNFMRWKSSAWNSSITFSWSNIFSSLISRKQRLASQNGSREKSRIEYSLENGKRNFNSFNLTYLIHHTRQSFSSPIKFWTKKNTTESCNILQYNDVSPFGYPGLWSSSLRGVLPGVGDLFDGNLLSLDSGCVPQSRIQHAFWIIGNQRCKAGRNTTRNVTKRAKQSSKQLSRCELNVSYYSG